MFERAASHGREPEPQCAGVPPKRSVGVKVYFIPHAKIEVITGSSARPRAVR